MGIGSADNPQPGKAAISTKRILNLQQSIANLQLEKAEYFMRMLYLGTTEACSGASSAENSKTPKRSHGQEENQGPQDQLPRRYVR
jgi:hypothetical protein